jgi:hypothetical protein
MPDEADAGEPTVGDMNQIDSTSRSERLQQALTVIAAWAEVLADDPDLPDHVHRGVVAIQVRANEAVRLLRSGVLGAVLPSLLYWCTVILMVPG